MKKLTEEQLKETLHRYVEPSRPTLKSVFPVQYLQNVWQTATNGRELLMVKAADRYILRHPDHNTPDVAAILPKTFDELPLSRELIESVLESVPVVEVDEECECECCEGEGQFRHYGETYDCKLCEETCQQKTGRKVKKHGHNYALCLDGKTLDFQLFLRLYELVKAFEPDEITYLRQKDNVIINGFRLDDEVLVWIAGLSDRDGWKTVVLPVEL